jgi:hypothetical protein
MADTSEEVAHAPAPPSFAPARTVLVVQAALSGAGTALAYPFVLAFSAMTGITTAGVHSMTMWFIVFATVPVVFHILAAVNLGITARGRIYLWLSVLASAVQVAILLAWGVYSLCLVIPIALCAILAVVNTNRLTQLAYLDRAKNTRRPLPDLITFAAGTALLITLTIVNNNVNNVENRHPAREFDSGESSERLESALDPLVEVLAGVEGMPGPVREHSDDSACGDGAGLDTEWSDYSYSYWFEDRDAQVNISPNAGAGQRALEAVRDYLTANGWDITSDEHQYEGFYRLWAVREDGVRITFEVGSGMTGLTANTGCVKHAGTAEAGRM